MRVADKMAYGQVNRNVAKNRSQMADLQNQAATQKRVTKPSDDPIAASRVLSSRVELKGNQQFLKNLDNARSFLEFTDQSLGELTDLLSRTKELAINQANDASSNEQSRKAVATEVKQLYNQMVQISNRKLGDRFIFGGYKTTEPPFDFNGKYSGDEGEMMIPVDKESFVAMNIPGSKVFEGKGLARDGISHATTRQPTNVEELIEQRQNLSAPKASPALQKDDENTQLRGPASVAPNSAQQESEELDRSGVGTNLFDVVKRLEVALRTSDKASVQDSLDRLDEAMSQVILSRAQVGSRAMVLDSAMDTLQKQKVDSQVMISKLEDADIFKVVSDINKTQGTLEATLQTSGRLIEPTLLDFLR